MPRTGYEPDTQPFDIIVWIAERMDLQLAAVAGPGVNGPNTERTAEYFQNARLQSVNNTQRVVTLRRWFSDDPCAADLA